MYLQRNPWAHMLCNWKGCVSIKVIDLQFSIARDMWDSYASSGCTIQLWHMDLHNVHIICLSSSLLELDSSTLVTSPMPKRFSQRKKKMPRDPHHCPNYFLFTWLKYKLVNVVVHLRSLLNSYWIESKHVLQIWTFVLHGY